MSNEIRSKIRLVSEKYQYIPWASKNEILEDIRNKHYSRPTHAAGVWVGYEDMDPTVQGNSETGHQQIGNLAIAPQIPMFICQSIKNKSFYSNTQLTKTIDHATNLGKNIGINLGKTKIPKIDMPIDTITVIILSFLLEIPLASCGKRYLKTIDEDITKIVKI